MKKMSIDSEYVELYHCVISGADFCPDSSLTLVALSNLTIANRLDKLIKMLEEIRKDKEG